MNERKTPFETDLLKVQRLVRRLHTRALGRLERQQKVLADSLAWEDVNHQAMLLQSNLFKVKQGLTKIEVEDWRDDGKLRTLELEPRIEAHMQVAMLFKKARKLKAAIPYAERQLGRVEADVAASAAVVAEADAIANQEALDAFCQKHRLMIEEYGVGKDRGSCVPLPPPVKKVEPAKPYHEFFSEAGIPIWVGKNAKNNDTLSFQCADGSDWWMHAHDYPGSHVVIRTKKGVEPDAATLADAAELAMRYSKAKDLSKGEVTLTQVKYLRSVRGCPGKVMLSKHKVMRVVLNESRLARLKASRVGVS